MKTNNLVLARKTAAGSKHPQHFMGAVVVKGGKVLSRAHNLGPGRGHAETRALRPHANYEGADIYVVRLNGKMTSRPCMRCAEAIFNAGIANVFYTDINGVICRISAAELHQLLNS